MTFVFRSALLGGSIWIGLAFLWSLTKWLFIPVALMNAYNGRYESITGTDVLRAQEAAQVAAQRALVRFSPVTFTFDTPGNFVFPDARVTINNDSDGVASDIRLICSIPVTDYTVNDDGERVPSTQEFTYTVKPPANKVVRAHKTVEFKLDTPMISQPRRLGVYAINCVSNFTFQPSPKG